MPSRKMSARKLSSGKPAARKSPSQKISAGVTISHWLFKSEPDVFSWEMLKARGKAGEPWDGVRNYQARNNMRAMRLGDLGFFYHSNEGKEIVGILEVAALAHPDAKDGTGTWECVDVRAVRDMPAPVPLVAIKDNPKLAKMMLVVNSRLSVQPVTDAEWDEVCRMGGLDAKKRKG
jgi:predicted RNA-binding protein with PUA-like domain